MGDNPRQHHPALKIREERQEEMMMGDSGLRFPGTLAPSSASQTTRRETRGDYGVPQHHPVPTLRDKRQEEIMTGNKGSRFPGVPRQYNQVRKLQEERQEEIMIGDEDLRFPGALGSTIRFPNYKKRHKRRL